MKTAQGQRIQREYRMKVKAAAEEVFPLLCPVREYEWIPHWQCRIVYTESGYAETGCVFQTDSGDQYGTETWVVSQYEPNRKIAFVRTGNHRTTRYEITLSQDSDWTTLLWRQEITAVSDTGNDLIRMGSETDFSAMMNRLEQLLTHYLESGTMLR